MEIVEEQSGRATSECCIVCGFTGFHRMEYKERIEMRIVVRFRFDTDFKVRSEFNFSHLVGGLY